MLFLSLYKRLLWCLKCCAFINLGEINVFTLGTIVSLIKHVQQYGRLKLVTMEMEKLYTIILSSYLFAPVVTKLLQFIHLVLGKNHGKEQRILSGHRVHYLRVTYVIKQKQY